MVTLSVKGSGPLRLPREKHEEEEIVPFRTSADRQMSLSQLWCHVALRRRGDGPPRPAGGPLGAASQQHVAGILFTFVFTRLKEWMLMFLIDVASRNVF